MADWPYNTAAWRRLRDVKLRQKPLCGTRSLNGLNHGATMNQETTHNLTEALRPWLTEALAMLQQSERSVDAMTELRKSMEGNGDVRVVFHVRENAFSIECATYVSGKIEVVEIFRELLVPDSGFALPDDVVKQ
jgi:hypothetical protein